MLKKCINLYYCLNDSIRQIKFKKDYIIRLRNIVDFVIVDDRRNVRNKTKLYMKKLL